MFDWNDVRAFLAVAESGSTLAAGRALRVSQTTAARRVAALEAALGLTLFERRQAGYALTDAGRALVAEAGAMRASAGRLADAAAAQTREAGGVVRLTSHEIMASTILVPILRDLHAAHPGIVVEMDVSDEVRDLAAGAADVALRSTLNPVGGGLVGRRLCAYDWTVYCSRDYAAANGRPTTREALARHGFIGGGGDTIWRPYREWLVRMGLEQAVTMHHGSAGGLLAAVRGGLGLAVLPCLVAEQDPDLVRCVPPLAPSRHGLFLLTHERVRHVPRVRIVIDMLADRLTRLVRALPDGSD